MADEKEILALWNALQPKVDERIRALTSSCVRTQRATVVTAPNPETGKIVVQIPFDDAQISLPYSSAVANVTAGSEVWILVPHDQTLSNGVVVQNGSWSL